ARSSGNRRSLCKHSAWVLNSGKQVTRGRGDWKVGRRAQELALTPQPMVRKSSATTLKLSKMGSIWVRFYKTKPRQNLAFSRDDKDLRIFQLGSFGNFDVCPEMH